MPAQLPSAIKRLRGTLRADRLNPREPRPRVGLPAAPETLPAPVRDEYRRLAKVVVGMRVATIADGPALELLAFALVEHAAAAAVLAEKGRTYSTETPTGSTMIRARPEAQIAADAWRRALAGLAAFGLTPQSRGKVEAVPEPDPEGYAPKVSTWAAR